MWFKELADPRSLAKNILISSYVGEYRFVSSAVGRITLLAERQQQPLAPLLVDSSNEPKLNFLLCAVFLVAYWINFPVNKTNNQFINVTQHWLKMSVMRDT